MDIYFSSNQEVISFCEYLFSFNKNIELHWKTTEDFGNHIHLTNHEFTDHETSAIAKAMSKVFFTYRFSQVLTEVIQKKFHYSNQDEIDRIVELTDLILYDKGEYELNFDCLKSYYDYELYSLFVCILQEKQSFHFDSIIQFRLNDFKEKLLYMIGLAIDEFKREEEHQAFIEMLRKFITKKSAIIKEIHILQGENLLFFTANGKQLTNIELRNIVQKQPLYMVGLEGNELNLAPLVAMAPHKIVIYGDHPSEPKTLTIINVFEERVTFKSFADFPFPQYLRLNHL